MARTYKDNADRYSAERGEDARKVGKAEQRRRDAAAGR